MQEEEKEYIIKNHRLLLSLDLTKSTIQDICNYLNYFECKETLSDKEKIKRYKELVSILKDTVSAYNDDYAIIQDESSTPSCKVEEWELPYLPREKAEYISDNLSTFIKKYDLLKRANSNRKPGTPIIMVGFTKKSLQKFLKDYQEINNAVHSAPENIKAAYKSIFLQGVSQQEYANQHFDGKKHKATYLAGQIKEIIETYYQDKENQKVKEVAREKSNKKWSRISKLYNDAEDRALQRMIEKGTSTESYYDYYKEECMKVDQMLEDEEYNKKYSQEIEIAKDNKRNGRKDHKMLEMTDDGEMKITYLTSEIQDIPGDEEYLDNKIFKKKK